MTILNILTFPHPNLRIKAKPIEKITPQVKNLSTDMLKTMYASGGIGLAATQVNVAQRLVVMDISKPNADKRYKYEQGTDSSEINFNKPIILYAPTWGSKKNKLWGLNNLKYLSRIDNLVTIPHTADYTISKIFKNVTVPKNRQELNNILHLADIVISDISLLNFLILDGLIIFLITQYPSFLNFFKLNFIFFDYVS